MNSPKIDSHVHILDPKQFPYAPDVWYEPIGAEQGTAADLTRLMASHGVQHAMLVQPNSGYGYDNRAMLSAIANGDGRFKGMAVVKNNASLGELQDLKAQGIVGIAMNAALLGIDFYADIDPLLERLRDLGMWAQMQVQHDQLVTLSPMLEAGGTKLMFDHCGRPEPTAGVAQKGFQALLKLADTGRAAVKLSGFNKCSVQQYPWADAKPFVDALMQAYTPQHLIWASDWPFLKAPARIDYGPLLTLFEELVPDATTRHAIQWETPKRLFNF
jgi:predicted TIM-barrel fold metal-dependent hydrolase